MRFETFLRAVTAAPAVILSVLVLAGCATKPSSSVATAPSSAPAVQSLQQLMQEASQAAGAGQNKERARELYRTAARTYPASKEPWVKLAEDYFDAGNYGQAILAAQEVMQRDPQDSVASSVLAVSGLRVSAASLATLRDQNAKLVGGPRTEAQSLAKVLRDALGEAELVPQAVLPPAASAGVARPVSPPPTRPRAAPRSAAASPVEPVQQSSTSNAAQTVPPPRPPAAAATPAATARPSTPAAATDPFKILKK